MVKMTERVLISCVIAFAVALTVSLILPIHSNEVRLHLNPQQSRFSVPSGRPFSVMCEGEVDGGGSFTDIDWLDPDGVIVTDGEPGVFRLNQNSVNLTFADPSTRDSGLYTCRGVFGKESLEVKTYIFFYGAEPRFESAFEEVTVKEGSRLELVCSATGDPIPIYHWYDEENNEIDSDFNSSISVINWRNSSTLIIRNVAQDHAGLYTCNANNTHGLANKLFQVSVESKTGNETDNITGTIKQVDVIKVTDSSVQFDIQTAGNVNVIEVLYFEKLGKMNSSTLLTSGGKHVFHDLVPGGIYTFEFSSGSDVVSVQVVLLPSAPEVLLRGLEDGILRIELFRKFEDISRGSIDKYELSYYTVRKDGDIWRNNYCVTAIELPSCSVPRHSIAGLQKDSYYEITLRAHTSSGFGKYYRHKLRA